MTEGEHSVTGHCQRPREGRAAGASEGGESQEKVRNWRASLVEKGEAVGGEDAKRGDVFRGVTAEVPSHTSG